MKTILAISALAAGLALNAGAASATTNDWTTEIFKPSPAGYTDRWQEEIFKPSPGVKDVFKPSPGGR